MNVVSSVGTRYLIKNMRKSGIWRTEFSRNERLPRRDWRELLMESGRMKARRKRVKRRMTIYDVWN